MSKKQTMCKETQKRDAHNFRMFIDALNSYTLSESSYYIASTNKEFFKDFQIEEIEKTTKEIKEYLLDFISIIEKNKDVSLRNSLISYFQTSTKVSATIIGELKKIEEKEAKKVGHLIDLIKNGRGGIISD